MGTADRIRILLIKCGNISISELAKRLGTTPQNMYNKMSRDNFSEKELHEIAAALGCTYISTFRIDDTGEEV